MHIVFAVSSTCIGATINATSCDITSVSEVDESAIIEDALFHRKQMPEI